MKFFTLTIIFYFFWLTKSSLYIELFPPNSGAPNSDVYLRFTYPVRIPSKTIFSIQQTFTAWKYSAGTLKDKCWCNFDYISCNFNGQLTIQTSVEIPANTIIEIYLDSAITLGSVLPGNYPGFLIVAAWLGVTIAWDENSDNTVTIKPLISSQVLNWQMAWETKTPGGISNYKFMFTSNSDINPGDIIIINFDRKFNPWLCEPKNLNFAEKNEKNDYYIGCTTGTLGNISCRAKHWYLIVTGVSNTVLAGNVADVYIQRLWTPPFGQVYFRYYILDSNYVLKSYLDAVVFTINNDSPSAFIDLKSVKISDNHLLNLAKYEFEFYVGNFNLQNYIIFVQFPEEYNLAESPPASCNATYFDESVDPNKEISWFYWPKNDYCSYYNGYATISIPFQSAKQFTSKLRIKIAIDGIKNPQLAYKNTAFDSWETLNQASDSYTSGKFDIEIYDATLARSIAKSWGLFHNVHAGLNKTNKSFQFVTKGIYQVS